MVRFVTLFIARSGSSYFIDLLSSHEAIEARFEVFAEILRDGHEAGLERSEIGRQQIRWALKFYDRPPNPATSAWGFKTKLGNVIAQDAFARLVARCNVAVILLERRNVVKVVISYLRALRLYDASGVWNVREDERPPPIKIDPDEFDSLLQRRVARQARVREFADSLNARRYDVNYEALLTHPQQTMESVCNFLGVESTDLASDLTKNTSDDLRRSVVNLDELRVRYRESRFEPMFDEVLVSGGDSPDGGFKSG